MDRQPHPSLYFLDGNIILTSSQSSGKQVLYRVHQSMLALNSPVFKHMLSTPENMDQTYDGVPLMELSDTVEQLESLLDILYWRTTLPLIPLDPNTPFLVKGVLALATKYKMDRLRQRIVSHLEYDWPQSLWEWDRQGTLFESMLMTWAEEHNNFGMGLEYLDDHLPEPVSAIRLARDCGVPSLLPSTFYHLSRIPLNADRHALRMPDSENGVGRLLCGQRTADWEALSSSDFVCLLKGREALALASSNLFGTVKFTNHGYTIGPCRSLEEPNLLTEIRDACRQSSDLLETLHQYIEGEWLREQPLCWMCRSKISEELQKFRRSVWDKLPEYFRLK